MTKTQELIERRKTVMDRAKAIHRACEGRDMSEQEGADFDAAIAEGDKLSRMIERQVELAKLDEPNQRFTTPPQPIGSDGNPQRSGSNSQWRDQSGRAIHVLSKSQRMSDLYRDPRFDSLSFGRTIRGLITGQWNDASIEQRTMAGNVLTAAGYLVPSPLSSEVIDYARNASVCFQAGARTVPMTSDSLSIARQTADADMEVKSENAAFTGDDVTFDRVTLATRTIGCLVKSSMELAMDAPNFEEIITASIANALAAEIDKQCLVGAFPGMAGLQHVGGINTVTSVGTPTVWTKWVEGVGKIWQDNHRPNAIIMNGRDATTTANFKDSTTQPLQIPPALAGLTQYITNALPTTDSDGAGSSSYIGDFTRMLVGVRSDITVDVSTHGEAFEKYQVWLRVTWRGDMNVTHPAAFCRLSGITA